MLTPEQDLRLCAVCPMMIRYDHLGAHTNLHAMPTCLDSVANVVSSGVVIHTDSKPTLDERNHGGIVHAAKFRSQCLNCGGNDRIVKVKGLSPESVKSWANSTRILLEDYVAKLFAQ